VRRSPLKKLSILGSTGSIGTATLDVVEAHPGYFQVVALGAGRNLDLLVKQVRRFHPELVATANADSAEELRNRLGGEAEIVHGIDGLEQVAVHPGAGLVVCGLVGALGLRPTYAAIDAGKDVAFANKESLVVGGKFMTARANETGASILPVDSEHNALHQCLRGERISEVRNLWLTASGGPFRMTPAEELRTITPAQALDHPTWKMGRKVTIDSATLMNKGLEIIEAYWLFGVPSEKIRVVVHPQSVIHSMVEFVDGSFKAQVGVTDMRHPIQYALTWPDRLEGVIEPFNPVGAGPLEFEEPDTGRFPCLRIARDSLEAGGAAPAVVSAANDVVVEAFLEGRAGFMDIPTVVEEVLGRHSSLPCAKLEDLIQADAIAREAAQSHLAAGV